MSEQIALETYARRQRVRFDRTRLERAFEEFHAANPRVFELFEKFAFEVIGAGHRHYSADAILHRIRWHVAVETKSGDGFKINDHHSAYYARLFEARHPERSGFFRTRRVREA